MALKVPMLRSRINERQRALDALRNAADSFMSREAELAADIDAAATDEERSVIDEAIEAFEQERAANEAEQARIAGEIADYERQIGEIESAASQARSAAHGAENRGRENTMPDTATCRARILRAIGETPEQRAALVAREDVKGFLQRVRELKAQSRDVKGAELGVPDVLLGVLRDTTERYSKLLKYITIRPLKGKARQNVAGAVPEAIWTEMVATLNELDISFTQVELDGYKVGGYVAVPNSDLEDDTDLQLLASIIDYLGQSIGLACDKAIVYGTGVKMPVGFVTRLVAASQPAWWGAHQGTFTDLSARHVLKLNLGASTGVEFFSGLIAALAIAKPNYATSGPVWIMNRKTHLDVICKALAFSAAGALVAGMQNTMPVIGGDIVELEFMADNDIAGGYMSLELWAERSGTNLASSDIPLFLEDMTVFKGTQRYDGKPIRGEAFVLVNYANAEPQKTVSFEPDLVNAELGTLVVTSAAGAAGKSVLTVAGNTPGASLVYKVGGQSVPVKLAEKLTGWTALPEDKTIDAAAGNVATVAELNSKGQAVAVGSTAVTVGAAG